MFLGMGFQGNQRAETMGPQEPKERLEINGTLAYGQVIVMAATVIMGMDFFQECSKGFDPSGQGVLEKLC